MKRHAFNYYNEIEPFAAAWLRNLIAAGELPAGDVDERSIVDVQPGDLRGYGQCHFFAGIGGWPYALGLAGWEGEAWTGSCPCQPFSVAGSGKGTGDERHLWPAFRRLIEECQPAIVFGEQVASADGRLWLAGVQADVEALGYDFYIVECGDGKARRAPSGISLLAHGVPGRVGALKGYGNAIVPPLAAEFVRATKEARVSTGLEACKEPRPCSCDEELARLWRENDERLGGEIATEQVVPAVRVATALEVGERGLERIPRARGALVPVVDAGAPEGVQGFPIEHVLGGFDEGVHFSFPSRPLPGGER